MAPENNHAADKTMALKNGHGQNWNQIHHHPTLLPSEMTMYSSPTIIFISLSTMKFAWSGVKALDAGSYMNLAKSL